MASVAEVRGMVDRAVQHLREAQTSTSVANDARETNLSSLRIVLGEVVDDAAALQMILGRLEGNTGVLNGMLSDTGDGSLQQAEVATYSAGDAAGYAANALTQAADGSSSHALQNALVSSAGARQSYEESSGAYIIAVSRVQEAVAMLGTAAASVQSALQSLPREQLEAAVVVTDQAGTSLEQAYASTGIAIEQAETYVATLQQSVVSYVK